MHDRAANVVISMTQDIPNPHADGGADAPPPLAGDVQKPDAPKPKKRKKRVDATKVARLYGDFRYEYGTNVAWDCVNRIPILISNLKHTFGADVVNMWLVSEKRKVVMPGKVVFDPTGTCGPDHVNLFGGLQMKPKKGDCEPILDLLLHLCDQDETIYAWILDWIAWKLHNLGVKIPTAIIMHGDEGSGKNVFWEAVMSMFGEYAGIVGQSELESPYNDWLSKKLFIVGDEVVSRQEMRHLKGKMKALISGLFIQIQAKFLPVRQEMNHVSMVFLSNELQPSALDASDRRHLVVWTPPSRQTSYYRDAKKCIQSGGGVEALMAYLLERDLSEFDPYAPPPVTKAKNDLIDLSRPNPERFWIAWMEGEIPVPFRACSADQAFRAYRRWCSAEGERFSMSKAVFSRMVQRVAKDRLQVRIAKIGPYQTARMWLPVSPPENVDFGAWAREAIGAFEPVLKDYQIEL